MAGDMQRSLCWGCLPQGLGQSQFLPSWNPRRTCVLTMHASGRHGGQCSSRLWSGGEEGVRGSGRSPEGRRKDSFPGLLSYRCCPSADKTSGDCRSRSEILAQPHSDIATEARMEGARHLVLEMCSADTVIAVHTGTGSAVVSQCRPAATSSGCETFYK